MVKPAAYSFSCRYRRDNSQTDHASQEETEVMNDPFAAPVLPVAIPQPDRDLVLIVDMFVMSTKVRSLPPVRQTYITIKAYLWAQEFAELNSWATQEWKALPDIVLIERVLNEMIK